MNISLVNHRTKRAGQRGSTLLVALVMLVLLTLIAISAMNASSSSMQIVGNAQFREEANAVAQQAIEVVISNKYFMDSIPAQQTIDVNRDGIGDFRVDFAAAPVCLSYSYADPKVYDLPSSCKGLISCYWTVWDVTAVVSDLTGSGATSKIHQGVRTIKSQDYADAHHCGSL